MSKLPSNSLSLAATVALAAFVVAFALLILVGKFGILASVFLALLIASLVGIVLYLLWENPGDSVASAGAADDAPADRVAADAAAALRAEEEAARIRDLEEARQAEAAEAARKAAEEEAARKAAAAVEAERKAAEAAEAVRRADAERAAAAAAERTAGAAAPATAPAADEDYDGDGIREGLHEGTRPAGLDAPRNGQGDDLKQIKGIGPKLEKQCNSLGFWHFDQVAAWNAEEVAWVDANLQGFKGRVSRDEWVAQARILAGGGETEFSRRVEDGNVY